MTGVQTCALPISPPDLPGRRLDGIGPFWVDGDPRVVADARGAGLAPPLGGVLRARLGDDRRAVGQIVLSSGGFSWNRFTRLKFSSKVVNAIGNIAFDDKPPVSRIPRPAANIISEYSKCDVFCILECISQT